MNIKLKLSAFVIIVLSLIFTSQSYAQDVTNTAVANPVDISQDVEEGDIVCSYSEGFDLCENEYDHNLYGVIVDNPSVAFEATDEDGNNFPLAIESGVTRVKVTTENGSIQEGSKVTTSSTPGVAKLATHNGYVLGTALEPYASDDTEAVGTILVSINIHPATGLSSIGTDLIRALREGMSFSLLEPIDWLRYILAAGVVITSFILALIYFGRVGKTGVEAIGRNPLASKMIQSNVVLHIIVAVVIILAGLAVSYLILIL